MFQSYNIYAKPQLQSYFRVTEMSIIATARSPLFLTAMSCLLDIPAVLPLSFLYLSSVISPAFPYPSYAIAFFLPISVAPCLPTHLGGDSTLPLPPPITSFKNTSTEY